MERGCKFLKYVDPLLCERARDLVVELQRKEQEAENEVAALKRKLAGVNGVGDC